MLDKLEKNILATVVYYDGLNYPLTAFEIWKYLIRSDYHLARGASVKITLAQVLKKLAEKNLFNFLDHCNGFYFLRGRNELIPRRIKNGKISVDKIKKLRRVAWWLRFVPFVRMVAISGALAMKNARASSDLDLFIVFKAGKIWTGRTLVTGLVHILGLRRHGKKIANRVCLNFFVTDESLEVITKDLFSASEYMFLFPLYGFDLYNKFQIKNRWIAKMKPAYALTEIQPLTTLGDSSWMRISRDLGEIVLAPKCLENYLKKVEKKRIAQNPKTLQEGSLVYAGDDALVFLPDPHGPKIFEKFKEKLGQLEV